MNLTLEDPTQAKHVALLLTELLDPYAVRWLHIQHAATYRIEASYGGVVKQIDISEYSLTAVDPVQTVLASAKVLRDVMREELHKEWGDYPEVAVWATEHSFMRKGETIPGFAWPRWNNRHPSKKALLTGGIVTKGSEEDVAPKKVIVKQKGANPKKKVGKPKCPLHTSTEMNFNAIRNVFECPEDGCKLIARPKTEQPDGNVVLGKGNIEMRLVFTDKGAAPRVVLMSDNNVALDVTDFVDLRELVTNFDVEAKVRQAQQQGVSITRVAARTVPITISLAILGLDNA